MTKFTFNEVGFLIVRGFQRLTDGEYRRTENNGDYSTAIKDAEDEFTYHFDLEESNEDIDKANNNITENGLTWDELTEMFT